jgi:hypothetical protein
MKTSLKVIITAASIAAVTSPVMAQSSGMMAISSDAWQRYDAWQRGTGQSEYTSQAPAKVAKAHGSVHKAKAGQLSK